MSTTAAPPAGAERLLRAVLHDPDWREAVLGDLEEEHARVAATPRQWSRPHLVLASGSGRGLSRVPRPAGAWRDPAPALAAARGRGGAEEPLGLDSLMRSTRFARSSPGPRCRESSS